jgi:hypothetical protein
MEINKFIIFIFLIILLFYIIIVNKICNNTDSIQIYEYDTKIPGPKIVIIGGTHGNEPSGAITIKDLIKNLNNKNINLKKGKLILIPEVNYCGLRVGIRFIPLIGDLNRKYPSKLGNSKLNNICPINKKIIQNIDDADFVLDFHEGWGFHRITKDSMGSTISPVNTDKSYIIARKMLGKINNTIEDDKKKYNIFTDNTSLLSNEYYSLGEDIKGSLRYYQNLHKKNYILIETTGQNDIQPLNTRKAQCEIFINELLNHYQML